MVCVKDLQALYDYGYWANRKIFDVLAQLTQEEFTQEVAGSFGSVRNTMVHMMSAEWGWLDRSMLQKIATPHGIRRSAKREFPKLVKIAVT